MSLLPYAVLLALSQTPPPPEHEALKRTIAVESATIERAPDDVDALQRLGLAYLVLGDAKRAISPLEQLVRNDPESLDAKLLLARAYRLAREAQKAKSLLDAAIVTLPDDVGLHAERALLARSQDDIATALEHYKKAVELAPQDADLRFNLAEAYQTKRTQLDDAIATYKKALELRPDFVAAKVNLGKALAEKGLYVQAKEILTSATKESLSDAAAHYNLGVILMREGAVGPAVTEFERAVAVDPKHAHALNNLGVAWDTRANEKKALEYFKQATRADPTFAEAFFNQGMSYMKLNQSAQATKAFEQALKLEPGSSGPYVQLGTLFLRQGQKDRAVEAFKKAIAALDAEEKSSTSFIQIKKNFDIRRTTDAYRGLALAYLALGKADDAVATLKTAVERLPTDASARAALGEAYLAQGNFDGAVEQFKERLSREATTEARLDLARAYVRKRAAKFAEPLYKEILKTEPDNRAAAMGLVDLYLEMGRYAEAETGIKSSLKADANDLQALSRLGILKSRMGRPDEALEPLEKVANQAPLMFDARAEYAFLLFRGNPDNAARCISTMSDILTSNPRHALSLHYMGMCQYAKGDKQRAEESFKSALTADPKLAAAHFSLGELYEAAANDSTAQPEKSAKRSAAQQEYEAASALEHPEARSALKRLVSGK
jgi:tetratricopeptide (TPR) repeat protein